MVNWDSFDKIWASTSPLTPYEFSDPNYSQGWNFVGSTPPARQMWDSIQKTNDEKFKYLRDNFGTPNIVTQASQMTDTDKVYVYLGSEAGWNNGHWYYYDEGTSSWADGGVYNSVAFVTDTTLSIAGQPADAKATGDALALKSDLAGCTFTGNVGINADLSVTGDATIGTDLSVTGSSTLTGNVSANGDVTVVGDVSSANMTTSADATIGGGLSVTGTSTLAGNITTSGDISADNISATTNATVGGNLSVTGTSTLTGDINAGADIVAVGDISADNLTTTTNATIGGSLSVAGTSTLTGNVTASGNISAVGDITSANISTTNATIGGNATVTGDVSCANLTTSADATVGGDLTVTGDSTLADAAVNDLVVNNDLSVAGDSSLTNLSVSGTTALAGTSTAPTPNADDNSTKIATTEYVQTEIKPIEVNADIVDKRVTNIEKLLEGNLYDYQTDTDSKYVKSVPSGAMPYASLEQIGGKTVVWNQLGATSFREATANGIIFAKVSSEEGSLSGNCSTANFYSCFYNNACVVGHKYLVNVNMTTPYSGVRVRAYGTASASDEQSVICTANGTTMTADVYFNVGVVSTNYKPQIFDLTLLYGSGNEPSTVAEFQQTFPANYYPYSQGSLLSAGVTSVVSKGRNLLNPSPSNFATNNATITDNGNGITVTATSSGGYNYVQTILERENATKLQASFTASGTGDAYMIAFNVDENDTFVSQINGGATSFSVNLNSAYPKVGLRIYAARNTNVGVGKYITYSDLQAEFGDSATTFTPYFSQSYPIPAEVQALTGYGWSVQLYINNVYSGDVYNQIDFENKKYTQNVGKVTLNGSESWTWDTGNALAYTIIPNGFIIDSTTQHNTYVMSSNPSITSTSWGRRSMYTYTMGMYYGQTRLYCKSENFASANDVKTYFTNNPTEVNYVLETPIETDISAYLTDDNLIEVESGGTLTFPNSNGTDYQIPVPSAETYMVDLQASL